MLRHTCVLSELRLFKEDTEDPFGRYDLFCNVVWESPKTVWLRGMNRDREDEAMQFTRKMFGELVEFCVQHGIEVVKAHRAPGHQLPFGRVVGDHTEVIVSEAAATFMRRRRSDVERAVDVAKV